MADPVKAMQEENRLIATENLNLQNELAKTRHILWHVIQAVGGEIKVQEEQINKFNTDMMYIGTDPVPHEQAIKYFVKYYG